MKQKNINILAAIFLVLLVIASYSYWRPYLIDLGIISTSSQDYLIPDVDSISQITLTTEGYEPLIINRSPDGLWQVNQQQIDTDKLNQYLQTLANLQIDQGEVVSTNTENQQKYGLEQKQVIYLEITQTDIVSTYLIGSNATNPGSFYLKIPDQDNVYVVTSPLRDLSSIEEQLWRNKTLAQIDQEKIGSLQLTSTSLGSVTVEKSQQDQWTATRFSQTNILGENTTDLLFDQLSKLKASSLASDIDTLNFNNRSYKNRLNIYDQDQQLIFELDLLQIDQRWLVQIPDSQTVYVLSQPTSAAIFTNMFDIFTK